MKYAGQKVPFVFLLLFAFYVQVSFAQLSPSTPIAIFVDNLSTYLDVAQRASKTVRQMLHTISVARNSQEVVGPPIDDSALREYVDAARALPAQVELSFLNIPEVSIETGADHHHNRSQSKAYLEAAKARLTDAMHAKAGLARGQLALSQLNRDISLVVDVQRAITEFAEQAYFPLLMNQLVVSLVELENVKLELSGARSAIRSRLHSANGAYEAYLIELGSLGRVLSERLERESRVILKLQKETVRRREVLEQATQNRDHQRAHVDAASEELEEARNAWGQAYSSLETALGRLDILERQLAQARRALENAERNLDREYNLCPEGNSLPDCTSQAHRPYRNQWIRKRYAWKEQRKRARDDIERYQSSIILQQSRVQGLERDEESLRSQIPPLEVQLSQQRAELDHLTKVWAELYRDLWSWLRTEKLEIYDREIQRDKSIATKLLEIAS